MNFEFHKENQLLIRSTRKRHKTICSKLMSTLALTLTKEHTQTNESKDRGPNRYGQRAETTV